MRRTSHSPAAAATDGAAGAASCGTATSSPPAPARRRFLRHATLTVAALALLRLPTGWAASSPVRIDAARFPQSVASGDPRPNRVLLWTRVAGDAHALRLQVAMEADFARVVIDRPVPVPTDTDGCVRVRATGLEPATTYFYRFVDDSPGAALSSPVGRTRTAPAPDASVPLRLAFLSCQDYGGRWYNTLLPLLEMDLDAVVHLGDFIYETAGDPGFQNASAERSIAFDDIAGALRLGTDDAPFHAARSLDNYRQLHRTFRTDPALRRLLERAPLIAIWDDHEFSDDCWADNATYQNGRGDEQDGGRRRNAERAYFEYMPVDLDPDADESVPGDAGLFPHARLWRSLRLGRDVELWLTDYRSFRPDHLVPEDAFPAALALDRAQLEAVAGRLGTTYASLAPQLLTYFDPSRAEYASLRGPLREAITAAYVAEGIDQRRAADLAVTLASQPLAHLGVAGLLQEWNAARPEQQRVALPVAAADADRGLPWLGLGKTALFSSVGSRYFVVAPAFDLLAAARAAQGLPSALGAEQSAWLSRTMPASDATWKLVASSVSMTAIRLDLARPTLQAPEALRRTFYLNVDHWDGFPVERRQLIADVFDPAGGAIVLSGDIHAGFVTQHSAGTVEFTAPAVSSQTIGSILEKAITRDPVTVDVGRRLVAGLDEITQDGMAGLIYAQTRRHGVGVLELDAGEARMRFIETAEETCLASLYERPADYAATSRTAAFRLSAAERVVRRDDR